MCGSWGSEYCTPQHWFDFMGDATGVYVPFQINYVGSDAPGQPGCSCLDCAASCPAPPPRPPPPVPFSIHGADGYAVVMAIVFVIFTTLFLSGVFCCAQQENAVGVASDHNQEMATNPTSAGWGADQPDGALGDATFFEKLGAETETKLEDFFQCSKGLPKIEHTTPSGVIEFGPVFNSTFMLETVWGWYQNDIDNFDTDDNSYLDQILRCSSFHEKLH
ncbi:Niemann-Pick C1 protein [Operophtera brumata]|uniref:Niemann-Pick C1 protein n=1 Tax=Operophtera brumata TaxID=104452 RepID=A0A0L7LPE5_OPEBR|nr:Niemann-Pick C1 protein [Operophtera brumata]